MSKLSNYIGNYIRTKPFKAIKWAILIPMIAALLIAIIAGVMGV